MSIYSRALIGARSGAAVVGGGTPNPFDLALSGATFGPSASGFGQQLVGGSGTATIPLAAGDQTWELFSTPSDSGGFAIPLYLASGSRYLALCRGGDGTLFMAQSDGSPAALGIVPVGARRHVAVVQSADGYDLYLDGAFVGSTASFPALANPTLTLAAAGGLSGNGPSPSAGSGNLDEVRISSMRRYTGAFTPPAAPFVKDASTVALYHLDGNGSAA